MIIYIHVYLAKCRRRYQKLKCRVPGPLCKTLKDVLLYVNLGELEVLSAKCRGGQRSPSLVRRRGGKSKIRFSQRKLFILLPIAFNAILVQKVENGKCVAHALFCRCIKTVVSLLLFTYLCHSRAFNRKHLTYTFENPGDGHSRKHTRYLKKKNT